MLCASMYSRITTPSESYPASKCSKERKPMRETIIIITSNKKSFFFCLPTRARDITDIAKDVPSACPSVLGQALLR